MPASPYNSDNDLVNVTIKVSGSEMKSSYSLYSVNVYNEVNRIPTAHIVLFDGDAATGEFDASESSDFLPGTAVEVLAGYQSGAQATIFSGIIVRHGIRLNPQQSGMLELECKDKAIKMTVGRNNAYYEKKKDSDVISTLIGNSGLSASVKSTTYQHKELVQYYCTDWDFMVLRAEATGMIVTVNSGKVTVAPPATSGSPALVVTYGESIVSMNIEMDARNQLKDAKAVSWDPGAQAIVTAKGTSPTFNLNGNLGPAKLSEVLGKSDYLLQTTGVTEQTDMTAWATAQLMKSWLSRITGTVKFQGTSKALPDSLIELGGVGGRFNGNAYVSGVSHEIVDGNWLTEVTLGLPFDWFSTSANIDAPPASGLISAVQGLHAAVVKQIDQDPDGHTRIKVTMPMMQSDGEGVWARLSTFSASSGSGAFFMPEINDEVILGFMNNDPRFPVIIGSVYSSKNAPPFTPDKDNPTKAIVTKNKLKLTFEDKDKNIIIETPGGNKITISDKDKAVTISDQNSNTVKLDSSGILLDSAKSVTINAQQDIKLSSSSGKISLSAAAGDVSVAGLNIKNSAQMQFSAEGQAQAQVSATGQLTLKGAIVMIN